MQTRQSRDLRPNVDRFGVIRGRGQPPGPRSYPPCRGLRTRQFGVSIPVIRQGMQPHAATPECAFEPSRVMLNSPPDGIADCPSSHRHIRSLWPHTFKVFVFYFFSSPNSGNRRAEQLYQTCGLLPFRNLTADGAPVTDPRDDFRGHDRGDRQSAEPAQVGQCGWRRPHAALRSFPRLTS